MPAKLTDKKAPSCGVAILIAAHFDGGYEHKDFTKVVVPGRLVAASLTLPVIGEVVIYSNRHQRMDLREHIVA